MKSCWSYPGDHSCEKLSTKSHSTTVQLLRRYEKCLALDTLAPSSMGQAWMVPKVSIAYKMLCKIIQTPSEISSSRHNTSEWIIKAGTFASPIHGTLHSFARWQFVPIGARFEVWTRHKKCVAFQHSGALHHCTHLKCFLPARIQLHASTPNNL